ncbi:hypothetical protein GVN21_05105 [Caulobacter sp. SLTY]|uniref:hypothetical protein n=1 Tax=Caulobacter sp. SLTY TaxID=2683262 RepID=UPI0014126F59|nr:hypothetical protein [Caulobacter sp. SLTY]NBB14740.1 hypothetical protein [Caulobacter sp. SLTY]
MRLAVLAFVGSLLAAPALAQAPVDKTAAQVLAGGAALEGRTVRIRGFVDQCSRQACYVCDSLTPTPSSCLSLFRWRGAYTVEADEDGFVREQDALNTLHRFSEVVLTGQVDIWGDDDEQDYQRAVSEMVQAESRIVTCGGDRVCHRRRSGPWLDQISVERTLGRRSALDGLITDQRPLNPAPPSADAALREAFAARNNGPLTVTDAATYVDNLENPNFGWLCVDPSGRRPDRWPTLTAHLLPSPSNPYRCFAAGRDGERWIFYWWNEL